MYQKQLHIHFVGIGGIGMSGIAKILKYQGYSISGCDLNCSQESVQTLRGIGCSIADQHNSPLCQQEDIDVVVYSSDIQATSKEIIAAQKRGIPTIPRALMLAEIMRTKHSIAVSGSHGKTTTTSIISQILIEAGMNPTVIIGGILKSISTNAQLGGGDFLVAEADESDRSLIHLHATLAVVTNIDYEHVNTYSDIEDVKQTFLQFIDNLPFYGKAFVCIDDPHIRSLLPIKHVKMVTYGISNAQQADFYATDIELQPDTTTYRAWFQEKELGSIQLTIPGNHNVLNSLAAIATTLDLGVSFQTIQRTLKNFSGVKRRFSYHGTFKEAEIFDDYGHHPAEIACTLEVARRRAKGKLRVIFQPQRYTRTARLWDDFITVLQKGRIDDLVITDIYAANEPPITHITGMRLAQAITHTPTRYIPTANDFADIVHYLATSCEKDDLVLFLGAGKLHLIAEKLCGK